MTTTHFTTGNTVRVNRPQSTPAAVWEHLDAICVGDNEGEPRDLVGLAAETVEQVKAALISGKAIDRAALALLLDVAALQLHQTGVHLLEVVESLGENAMA